jgi:D-3-phosphoglycerate dehydrogenase / 2-oxoglutarate reductase
MENNINILITEEMHPALMEGLVSIGTRFTYLPSITSDEVSLQLKNHNSLIVRNKIHVDRLLLEQNQHLRFVGRAGAGMDNIDEFAAAEYGITCFNAGEGNRDAVGEHTLGLLLNLSNHITKSHQEIEDGIWDREGNRGFEIGSKTIGIIGFGSTGSAIAEKLSGFGSKIIAYDKYKTGYGSETVSECSYQEVLDNSDIITFHVPLTSETKGWIDESFIESVRKPFVLMNLSRGGIMKTESILAGLSNGKIQAFGTDVLENENMGSLTSIQSKGLKNLLQFPNVVLTPHVAGWTTESYQKISEVLLKRIKYFATIVGSAALENKKERHYV